MIKKSCSILLCTSLLLFSLKIWATLPTNFSLAPMIEKASPAVVNIKAEIKITDYATIEQLLKEKKTQGEAQIPDAILSVGSGVIVDADKGYILTNAHVVDDAQAIVTTLNDGRHFTAKLIGLDKPSDIALLQIQAKNLIAIQVSDSNTLKVGDLVVAIGNPFGLNQTVSSGIVSALGRTALGIENFENFIQTDAPINPGNSGGALINGQGQLVGINTAILAPNRGNIGIGFAIPSNMAKSVMSQLIEFGNVKRGTLGVGAQDITPELANALNLANNKGALITLILPGSPAEKAGMKVGDIITAVNNNLTLNANDVVNQIAFMRVNSKANIHVLRNNKTLDFSVEITDPIKQQEENEKMDPFLYGVGLKDLNILSPIHGDVNGVLIVSVAENSNAWHADLRPGDVIVSANQQKVTNMKELKTIAASVSRDLVVNVLRGKGALFLMITQEP